MYQLIPKQNLCQGKPLAKREEICKIRTLRDWQLQNSKERERERERERDREREREREREAKIEKTNPMKNF